MHVISIKHSKIYQRDSRLIHITVVSTQCAPGMTAG